MTRNGAIRGKRAAIVANRNRRGMLKNEGSGPTLLADASFGTLRSQVQILSPRSTLKDVAGSRVRRGVRRRTSRLSRSGRPGRVRFDVGTVAGTDGAHPASHFRTSRRTVSGCLSTMTRSLWAIFLLPAKHATLHPLLESTVKRTTRSELARRRLPLASGSQHIEDPVHHTTEGHHRTTAFAGTSHPGQQRLHPTPQLIRYPPRLRYAMSVHP